MAGIYEVNKIMQRRKEKPGAMKQRSVICLAVRLSAGNVAACTQATLIKTPKSKDNTVLTYYKCSGKCGNTSVRKLDIEQIALEHVHDVCFIEEAIQEVVQKVAALFREHQNSSGFEKKAIEKKMRSLENSIDNWIEALGKGIKGLESKILDAQSRYEALQIGLQKIESLNQTINISEEMIRSIIANKKHFLGSADEADQKEVLQEFVDQIVIQPSNHLDDFRAEITRGGVEPLSY